MGYFTYANDWQYYSYCLTASYLLFNDFPKFKNLFESNEGGLVNKIENEHIKIYSLKIRNQKIYDEPFIKVLSYLQNLKGKEGPFYNYYCEGGTNDRMYFSNNNGKKIQAIRDKIEEWVVNNLIDDKEKTWLVACLIESADRVANTASVYGAYLKKIKKNAEKPIELIGIKPVESKQNPELNKVFCQDALEVIKRLGNEDILLTYLDPPYNHRQYSANYHILETIARWDIADFSPRGVTGLRESKEFVSEYSLRSKAEDAYQKLFANITSKYILLSYSNEGLISEEFIRHLFNVYYQNYKFEKIEYQRFRADVDHSKRIYKTNKTVEYLVIGKK
jgi:adenine-specific DNA-methyltransferase